MGSRRRDDNSRSLHCRGYDTTRIGEKELRAVFSKFGRVVDVYLPKDYFTKKVRGFAYIQFEQEADADLARQKLDRSAIFDDNRTVNIMWAAGERKTPTDMRRLDIERDNPHARRIRENQARRDASSIDWRDRDRDRDHRDRGRDSYRPRHRSREPYIPSDRTRGYGYGGRPLSRSPPPRRMDDRRYHHSPRDRWYDRDRRDYRDRKRLRSRTPSPDRSRGYDNDRRRRRRSPSRSPPPLHPRSISPAAHHSHATEVGERGRPRSRSRTPSPRPIGRRADSEERGDESRFEDHRQTDAEERDDGEVAPKLRSVAPKLRSAPLSPVETTPASADSR